MELRFAPYELVLRHTFRIAHGASDTRLNVLVQVGDGEGEAGPVRYHNEDAALVLEVLERHRPLVEQLSEPAAITWLLRQVEGSQAAKASLDMALYDGLGKRLGAPVRQLLGLAGLPHQPTSFTLAIAEPEELRELAREARDYPIIKVKLGGADDLAALRIIRDELPTTLLRVDANGGWTAEQALSLLPALAELGVELVEQPLPKGDLDGLRKLRSLRGTPPIIADESVRTAANIPELAGLVDGVNIKLQKAGGISGALAAIQTARAHGMQVMLGCMIESSLGVSAALALAPLADYLDLDGPLLVANDPYEGLTLEGALWVPSDAPGLGVRRRAGT